MNPGQIITAGQKAKLAPYGPRKMEQVTVGYGPGTVTDLGKGN